MLPGLPCRLEGVPPWGPVAVVEVLVWQEDWWVPDPYQSVRAPVHAAPGSQQTLAAPVTLAAVTAHGLVVPENIGIVTLDMITTDVFHDL